MNAERLFDAIRTVKGKALTQADVDLINAALNDNEPRRISAKGLDLIKRSEGLRLNAYRCPANVPTIGYGSTGPHVRMGMTITEAEAERLLRDDVDRFERAVERLAPGATQGQFDSLVSLSFNIGEAAFERSTLLAKHRAGDFAGAEAQFARWNKGGGRVLPGLVTRRAAEAALYGGRA